MSDFHVQHLPVVSGDKFLGLLSEDLLLHHPNSSDPISTYDLSHSQFAALEHEHIFEILKTVHEQHLTLLPVTDKDLKYLGSITRFALLDYFAGETDITEPGGIIVIDLQEKDYLLSEIARIVEQNQARILGAFAGTDKSSRKTLLTLKLNVDELQPVLQALERYNYLVVDYFQEPEYFDNLKDRFDALMKYLNV